MKDKIRADVTLHLGHVNLVFTVNKKIKKEEGVLKGNGYIEISDGMNDSESLFYDNLQFFQLNEYQVFKLECAEDLKRCGFDYKETFKIIKRLLKRADKLNLL